MHDHDHDHDHGRHPARDHREWGSGGLRAAVFGASDGLVSNAALVLGVAGGSGESATVVLAGVAGLLAGASSMAAGEWVSVKAQAEALELELERERDHLERYPDEERDHMRTILERAGLSDLVAGAVVSEIEQNPVRNLDFHARMELGIDPDALGSPRVAAGASFVSFAVGASIPVAPWILLGAGPALTGTVIGSAVSLFAIGAALATYTRRSWWWSGLRQLFIGAVAGVATTLLGTWIGGA